MAINGTLELIDSVTVPSGGQAAFDFINIPQTYDDLVIMFSVRSANSGTSGGSATMRFNNDSGSNYSFRWIRGDGASATSNSASTTFIRVINNSPTAGNTASTFCNSQVYIPNYCGSVAKSVSEDNVSENNTTTAYSFLVAGLWTGTAAINRVTVTGEAGNFVEHSTAYLYGVTRVPAGAKATGGVIYSDNDYWYHTFTSSGVFTPSQSLSCDYIVVAGGGGGGFDGGGGGGAGGFRAFTSQSLTATNYTVTIGAGGAGSTSASNRGASGGTSTFNSNSASGGGGGGSDSLASGNSGGSGGGGRINRTGNTGGSGNIGSYSPSEGNNGAGGTSTNSGGGGGANAAGNNTDAGGGNGTSVYSSWGLATSTGENVGGTVYYAGGGGGNRVSSTTTVGPGGFGGGGDGSSGNTAGPFSSAGTANTGGGGGGGSGQQATAYSGSAGGSGIVIVRYAK